MVINLSKNTLSIFVFCSLKLTIPICAGFENTSGKINIYRKLIWKFVFLIKIFFKQNKKSFDSKYANLKPLQVNSQRQFSFKFDATFFSFLFDTIKIVRDDDALIKLGIHTYACVLNEMSPTNPGPPASLSSNSLSNLNENLIKAVQPQIIDYLFQVLTATNPNIKSSPNYMIINENFMWLDKNSQNQG